MVMAKVDFRERFNGTVMKDRLLFFCQSVFSLFLLSHSDLLTAAAGNRQRGQPCGLTASR